jgi:hypothetical protein
MVAVLLLGSGTPEARESFKRSCFTTSCVGQGRKLTFLPSRLCIDQCRQQW